MIGQLDQLAFRKYHKFHPLHQCALNFHGLQFSAPVEAFVTQGLP
jgi:hypothetical protein